MRSPAALFPVAALALTLGAASPARAQDAPDRGPTEIKQCQTISQPGSYKLTDNLTFTAPSTGGITGTCLSITASYVTIDLAGFTIGQLGGQQPGNLTMAVAAGENTTGIAVRNGSVSGFGSGVNLEGDNSIVEGLRIDGPCPCYRGIVANGIVRGNTVSIASAPDGSIGIVATGIVSGNYAYGNRSLGIFVGTGSTVIGNTATDTSPGPGIGIEVSCPSNVTNNTAVNNPGGNLVLYGTGCNNTNNVAP